MNRLESYAPTDEELVAAAQRRDMGSVAALYERYYVRVYRFALARLENPADAEDLTQEAFLKMVDKLPGYQMRGIPFSAWLFRVAHNCIIDTLRQRSRRGYHVPLKDDVVSQGLDLTEQVERAISREELSLLMPRLSPAQQEVLALRFGAELSVQETAHVLGKAEGTIKATQYQALQALRRILTAEGYGA